MGETDWRTAFYHPAYLYFVLRNYGLSLKSLFFIYLSYKIDTQFNDE